MGGVGNGVYRQAFAGAKPRATRRDSPSRPGRDGHAAFEIPLPFEATVGGGAGMDVGEGCLGTMGDDIAVGVVEFPAHAGRGDRLGGIGIDGGTGAGNGVARREVMHEAVGGQRLAEAFRTPADAERVFRNVRDDMARRHLVVVSCGNDGQCRTFEPNLVHGGVDLDFVGGKHATVDSD